MNLEKEIGQLNGKENAIDESIDLSSFHENSKEGKARRQGARTEFSKDDIIQVYDDNGGLKEIPSFLRIKEESIRTYTREEWLKVLKIDEISNTPNFEIFSSLREGIPEDLRPRIWFYLTSVSKYEKIHVRHFLRDVRPFPKSHCTKDEGLYHKLKSTPSKWDEDIEKDIPRTSKLEYFEAEGAGRKMLFNVLRAYTNYDSEVGYTQGMNFVVANILLALDPDRYDNLKVSFGKASFNKEDLEVKKNWREVYKRGVPKVKSLIKHFKARVSREVPEVYNHIQKFEDVTIDLCFLQSFVTILMYFTPPDLSVRILDLFLFRGESVLFDILTRMLNLCRKEILTLKTQEVLAFQQELFQFMHKDIVKYCYDKKWEMKTLVPLPQAEIIQNIAKE